ncbi:hypothetical protein QBC33DRAFT_587269 [Phialemonium atrogriseum]|uniref:SET domain-containing protein n=1 Tax=Phialemonium atrogriseum TaxID=1093897 RepID=A0AAJ0BYW5_9PEZI|nr:uncharacterized protein QBC33DRAFT_587269 [Phialemonium atrogriseum]KAK1767048.1 hypothetical protein QBC33DRAFT_587269 [Phialemonium atrogriseum]
MPETSTEPSSLEAPPFALLPFFRPENLAKCFILRETDEPYQKLADALGTSAAIKGGTGIETPGDSGDEKGVGTGLLRKHQPLLDGLEDHHFEGNVSPQALPHELTETTFVMGASPCTTECAEADAIQGMPPPIPSPVGSIADPIHTQAREAEVEGPSPVAPPNSPADKPDEASRVIFRNEFFEVRPSSLLGFGAFAVKELKYGDCILTERPLMRTTGMGLFKDFDDLDEEDKQIYMSLHGFSIKKDAHVVEKILRANSFAVPGGVAVFAVASRFNHACRSVRNVLFAFDSEHEVLKLTAAEEKIAAGTELFINYGAEPEDLYRVWGFQCSCGGCSPILAREVCIVSEETWSG